MGTTTAGRYEALEEFFRRHGVAEQYRKGQTIIQAETAPFAIFYIETGGVIAYSRNTRGEQHIHLVYGPGEYFPLSWLVSRGSRSLWYEALSRCTLRRVELSELQAALLQPGRLGLEMLRLAAEQTDIFLERINNLQYRFARERLVYCLLYMAQRFGVSSGTSYEIILRMSHQVIANNVNLSRESVGREIDRLVRKGMVEVRSGHIVLTDVPGLIAQLPGGLPTAGGWNLADLAA